MMNRKPWAVCRWSCGMMPENGVSHMKPYEYTTVLHEMPDNGGAYVVFPWDIHREFGKGRMKVHALFDGFSYDGSIVNMGLKNEDGSVCYIIGVLKSIRKKLNKSDGDLLHVVIEPAQARETDNVGSCSI